MLSPLHPQHDPSSDKLSPNGPSSQGACVGQYVWNQLYKGGLSPPSLCIQPGHAQLLGQGGLGATAGAAALLRTPLLLSFGRLQLPCRRSRGNATIPEALGSAAHSLGLAADTVPTAGESGGARKVARRRTLTRFCPRERTLCESLLGWLKYTAFY